MIAGFVDTETTGKDANVDQIIELGVAFPRNQLEPVSGGGYWRIRPTVPIHPEAQSVHGITAESLAHAPRFEAVVAEITTVFSMLDVIVGYNLDFDLRMIEAEYKRVGQPHPFKPGLIRLDVLQLWRKLEPRDLGSAHKRFCGVPIDGAHSALTDASATRDVLDGMLDHFGLAMLDWELLANRADPERLIRFGPSNHLRWNGEMLTITFGKHQGKGLVVLAATTADYLRWMLEPRQDFPPHVKEACRMALSMSAADFHRWAKERR